MRDLILVAFIAGVLPLILWRPHVGVLVWTWVSFMNPHRLTWGFAYNMQFALLVALVTLGSLAVSREPKKIPWTRETLTLLVFVVWMTCTTVFAEYPELAWPQLQKVLKIQLMVFVTLMLMHEKARLQHLVWVIVLSLTFFGVKGGIFTLLNGGVYHVRGPAGSFIAGDNEIGLALIMTIPLLRYLQMQMSGFWVRVMFSGAMLLVALGAIGSQSRGAMLGMLVMGTFLWLKSRNKLFTAAIAITAALTVVSVMPQKWYDRMATIQTYDQDASAMGRINAWKMAFNLAMSRPLGGGFETFQPEMFATYAPEPQRVHDSHSIYFEVLGEHGCVGLALFLALGLMAWRSASWVVRRSGRDPRMRWAADLAAMTQVSLVGYWTAGAFLGLAYFDYYYTLIAIIVLCKVVVLSTERSVKQTGRGDAKGVQPQGGFLTSASSGAGR